MTSDNNLRYSQWKNFLGPWICPWGLPVIQRCLDTSAVGYSLQKKVTRKQTVFCSVFSDLSLTSDLWCQPSCSWPPCSFSELLFPWSCSSLDPVLWLSCPLSDSLSGAAGSLTTPSISTSSSSSVSSSTRPTVSGIISTSMSEESSLSLNHTVFWPSLLLCLVRIDLMLYSSPSPLPLLAVLTEGLPLGTWLV